MVQAICKHGGLSNYTRTLIPSEVGRFDGMECACHNRLLSVVTIGQKANQNTRIIILLIIPLKTLELE